MELELERNELSCYDMVLDTCVFPEETMEMIVPDACPDILRLVDTCGTVLMKSKEAQDGRAEAAGTVCCAVLYQPEGGGGIHRFEVNVPFFCAVENPAVNRGCLVKASPRLRAAESRVLNPRKVLVRVDLAVAVQVFSPCGTAVCSCVMEPSDGDIQQLLETQETYVVSCVQEKPFRFSDDLTVSGSRPAPEELLKSRVDLLCNESKVIGSKLIFKGEAALQVLYRSVSGQTCAADFQLPFSQIMEVSNVTEDGDCSVDVDLSGLSCEIGGEDGRMLSVSMDLLAQAVVREPRTVTVLSDIYSVSRPLTAEFENFSFSRLLEQGSRHQSAREVVETTTAIRSVEDTYVTIGALTQTWEGSRLTVSAAMTATALCENEEGELTAVTATLQVPCVLELAEDCACSCQCGCPGGVFATPTAGGVEFRLELDFRYLALMSKRTVGVSAARVEAAESRDSSQQPSIVLRVLGQERLWDIAKAYSTTTQDIMQANELTDGDTLSGRLLLIPKRR